MHYAFCDTHVRELGELVNVTAIHTLHWALTCGGQYIQENICSESYISKKLHDAYQRKSYRIRTRIMGLRDSYETFRAKDTIKTSQTSQISEFWQSDLIKRMT